MFMLVKNCSGGAAQRVLEITGISLPAIPMMTYLKIRFDSTGILENLPHEATSDVWPLGWGCFV